MKIAKYVITTEFGNSRDYLMAWAGNATFDDPYGLTWTSFETFSKCERAIIENDNCGILTIFNTVEDAEKFMKNYDIVGGEYTIREIIFDTRGNTNVPKFIKSYAMPGIGYNAMQQFRNSFT